MVHYEMAYVGVGFAAQFSLVAWIAAVILNPSCPQQGRLPALAQQVFEFFSGLLSCKVFEVILWEVRRRDARLVQ